MTIFNNDSNFNSTTIGLPDHIFINPETGEPDEKVLNDAIYLGNRRARKGSLKIFKDIFKKHSIKQVALRSDGHPTESVINAYCDQRFRMAMFNSAIKRSIHALKNGSSALSSEIVIPSFELVYFFKYASEIYSEKSTYDTKITSENGYSDGRVKESNITPPTNKDVLAGYQALFHIKNKLFNDLSQWSTLTEDKKKTLSCVALSIATLMNPDLLNEAFTIEPELRNYFTFMDKLSQHSSISDSLKRVEEKEAEESVEFVMAAIGDIYEQLKRSPKSKKLQRELIDSVSALHQYSSNFSEEDYSALLIEWVQSLIDIFSLYSFDDLLFAEGDQEFLVLVMMWVEYLSVQTSVAEDTDYFISHYQSVLSLVSSLASNQSNINTKIYELDSKVNEINSNLTSASLMVRRKKDKELRQIQSSINNLKDNIADIDDQVIATVLPESYTIESFDEDWGSKEVDPNEDFIDAYSNMLVAYKDWKDNQTDPQPLTTTDNSIPVVGSALDNQAEPPSLPTEEIGEAPPLSTATDESLESVEPDPVTPLDEEPSVEAEAEFEEVEEEVAVEIPSVSQDIVIDVEKELEVEIQEGHSEEGNACLYAWAHEIYIPGDLVNSAINRLIADDQIPMAAQISYAVANRKISDNVIPYELLKAAYYGMHTFNRRNVYTKSERILLKIQTNDFDQWDKLPMSGAVPYLLFMATFQPAIIGGKSNYPAILLKNIPQSCFGRNTIDLIDHIVKVSNRGEKITIDQLSIEGAITPQKTFNVQRVEDWCNVIRKSQKGYIPIKIALLNSLNNEGGLFRKITEILLNDRYEDENEVQDFISRFKEPSDSTEFLDNLLAGVDAYKTKITRTGKQTVHHKVSDLVDLAKDWLEAKPVVSTDSYTEDFCTQFAARLQIVILEFKEKSEETGASLERTAGARFVALRLGHLNRVIRGEVDVWEYSRVKAWYYHPRQIASLYVQHNDDTAPEVIQWLLARIGTEIRSVKQLELAYEKGDVRLSELLRHYLLDTNKEAPFHINIKKSFEEYLRDVRDRCNNIEGQLENVLLASEMDAETVDIYNAQIGDVQESLDRLMVLDETDDIEESLGNIETAIESTIESTKNNFLSRFDENVKQLRETIPDNAIPEEWIDDFHTTLNDNNLPVANEMIFDLIGAVKNHERIEKVKTKESPILREFIQHHSPIYKALDTAITEGRADKIFQLMKEHPENFGLEFPELSSEVKEPLLAIEHWRKGKPNTQVTETFYKQVSSVLNVLGINLLQPTYDSSMRGYVQYNAPTRGFASMYMNITESHSASPFPIFGSSYEEGKPIPVIIVYKEWKLDSVYELIKSENIIGDVQILISVVPVSLQKRNEFARFFQEMRMPVLLIDPVMLVFLASQDQDQIDNAAVRNFLWLAAPFSYFNPYSSDDSAKPTEFSEMVYGRDRQIQGLLKMVNGKAIVYGGRQLGKSTIMQQVRKRFHRPSQNQYAFYTMLDKDRHSRMEQEDSEKAHEGAQREIWREIHNGLVSNNLINSTSNDKTIDQLISESTDVFKNKRDCQFMVIFDEIDPILNIDSKHDFKIMRGLRELVGNNGGRFKVIIGGLQNVKRFEKSANFPLTQLGGSTQVSIMSTTEALQLVIEPMRAAGYEFENSIVANRILAISNRHPGLIQIFCNKLINYLGKTSRDAVGSKIIRNNDISATYNDDRVQELIKNRFMMTLNLDPRYAVIIYAIIDNQLGAKPFTVAEAKQYASGWLSDAFEQLSEGQFEAFLNELEGLGVLTKDRRNYALRSTNIIKLLTDPQKNDVANELNAAIVEYENYDPQDRHAFDYRKKDVPPSPITYRDERPLIGLLKKDESGHETISDETSNEFFMTSIIVGSNAQGLDQLHNALPLLCDEEKFEGRNFKRYKTHTNSTSQYTNALEFDKLIKILIKKSKVEPQMALLTVSEETEMADLLAMLDVTAQYSGNKNRSKYPIRIVILLNPEAYWRWLSLNNKTESFEERSEFLHLGYWQNIAVRYLLEKLSLSNASLSEARIAATLTQRWYYKLNELVEVKRSKDLKDIKQFEKHVKPVLSMPLKDSKLFLNLCGYHDVAWVKPLFTQMIYMDAIQFTVEEIEICVDDINEDITLTDKMIKWMTRMGLLLRIGHLETAHRDRAYKMAPSILHAVKTVYPDEQE